MFESKYSKVLTVILVIIIIAILGLLAFLGYDFYQKYYLESEAEAFVSEFENTVGEQNNDNTTTDDGNTTDPLSQIEQTNTSTTTGSGQAARPTFKGFGVVGTMSIPAINFNYPVLEKVTPKSIETSVAVLYPVGQEVNQVGNLVIIGHNYRNGLFFSNVKRLQLNDKIYITDNSGNRLTYTIYNKFETTPEDTSFYQRDTNGKPEVTLSTCTDDSKARIIIFARAD